MAFLQIFEILLIGTLVVGQLWVFLGNMRRIGHLRESYPEAGEMAVVTRPVVAEVPDVEAIQPAEATPTSTFELADTQTIQDLFAGAAFQAKSLDNRRFRIVRVNNVAIGVSTYHMRFQSATNDFDWQRYAGSWSVAYQFDSRSGRIDLNDFTEQQLIHWLKHEPVRLVKVRVAPATTPVASSPTAAKPASVTYDAVEAGATASPTFSKIVADTNEYLLNNKGAAADFNILKDISERHAEAGDEQIQAQLSTPLYLGLLGTFLGAIIGLISIIPPTTQVSDEFLRPLHAAISGKTLRLSPAEQLTVNTNYEVFKNYLSANESDERRVYAALKTASTYDNLPATPTEFHAQLYPENGSIDNEAIRKFLLGIMIAMVGSFFGLGFTLAGNNLLQNARARRDELKNSYYTFLQKALLPKLNSDMQTGLASLRAVLNTFNQDFFGKIQKDFFGKIAEFTPLVAGLTANISLQKDFLAKLQDIGITKMANATVKVFDRVDESAQTFEKFLGYQHALNATMSQSTQVFSTISALLNRLTSLEQALLAVPGYMQQHDAALSQQIQAFKQQLHFFTQHDTIFQNASDLLRQKLDKGVAKLDGELDTQLQVFERNAQEAYAQWQSRFERLNEDNIYDRLTQYLNPFRDLPAQQQALNKLQEEQARRSAAALTALQQRIERDEQVQRELLTQITRTNTVLEKMSERSLLDRLFGSNKPAKPNGQAALPKNRQPQPEA